MSETENDLLKTEIARLNKIIEALLLHNEVLKKALSIQQTENVVPKSITSIHQTMDGINEINTSIHQTMDGINEVNNSIHKTTDGINETNTSIHKTMDGSNEANNSIHQTMDGINEKLQELPHEIDLKGSLPTRIRIFMKDHDFKDSTHDGLWHSAAILMHIYNKNHCSSVELRKATGLSVGGLAKRMMSLKSRGYIVRTGKQKFALTEKGLDILRGALK